MVVRELSIVTAFKALPPDTLAVLERGASLTNFPDGANIFRQGDAAGHVCAVVSPQGRVRVGSADDAGKALMVEVFATGELFGEIAVIDGGMRTADALADGALTLLRIRAAVFLDALDNTPALGAALARLLCVRLRRTFSLLEGSTFETVERHLARQLIYLGEREGREVAEGLRLRGRFRQGDLADLVGASTRTIITVLAAWRAAGVVAYDTTTARITLLDRVALAAIVQRGRARN
jgi:CRP/FNR family transcriptional regulator, cyclic AMP receptor protein